MVRDKAKTVRSTEPTEPGVGSVRDRFGTPNHRTGPVRPNPNRNPNFLTHGQYSQCIFILYAFAHEVLSTCGIVLNKELHTYVFYEAYGAQ